jgi:hypothetical protein
MSVKPYPDHKARLKSMGLVNEDDRLIENVTLPSGLHRAHIRSQAGQPKIEDWMYLVPADAHMRGAWAYTDEQGLGHLVMAWREAC